MIIKYDQVKNKLEKNDYHLERNVENSLSVNKKKWLKLSTRKWI
jgi:hypothetical protein